MRMFPDLAEEIRLQCEVDRVADPAVATSSTVMARRNRDCRPATRTEADDQDAPPDGSRPASGLGPAARPRRPPAGSRLPARASARLGRDGRGLRGVPEEPAQARGVQADPSRGARLASAGCGGSSPRRGPWPGSGTRTSSACTASAGWPTAATSWSWTWSRAATTLAALIKAGPVPSTAPRDWSRPSPRRSTTPTPGAWSTAI